MWSMGGMHCRYLDVADETKCKCRERQRKYGISKCRNGKEQMANNREKRFVRDWTKTSDEPWLMELMRKEEMRSTRSGFEESR